MDKDEQNCILLVLRDDIPFWNLPWWWLESWEVTWEEGILEVNEEKGLDVKVEHLLAIYAKEDNHDLVFLFLYKKNWGTLVLNDEAQGCERYPLDQLPENIFPQS